MSSSSSRHWESFKKNLAFDHDSVEARVGTAEALTAGLRPEALYSSADDLRRIFASKFVKGTFVDLGCGVGIPSLVYAHLFPDRDALGVDVSSSRLEVAQELKARLQAFRCQFVSGDLLKTEIPAGDTYFLYFPTGPVLDRVLLELYQRRGEFSLVAIESHGDLFARLGKEPWLELSEEIPLSSLRHSPVAHLYVLVKKSRSPSLHDHSFRDDVIVVQEQSATWLGDSLGLEWIGDDAFNLKHPPRTIRVSQVLEIKPKKGLSDLLLHLLAWRRLGELSLEHENGNSLGFLRKIVVSPSFSLEISTGEKIEWESVKTISWGEKLCYESSSHFYFLPLVH